MGDEAEFYAWDLRDTKCQILSYETELTTYRFKIIIKRILIEYYEEDRGSNSINFLMYNKDILKNILSIQAGQRVVLNLDKFELNGALYEIGALGCQIIEVTLPFKLKGFETCESYEDNKIFKFVIDCYQEFDLVKE